MNLPHGTTNATGLVVGTGATTTPLWWNSILEAMPPIYQALSMTLGLLILVLTVRKLYKENRRLDREERGP